jgi:dihydrofolate synthase / folylpolyglutamate synthase
VAVPARYRETLGRLFARKRFGLRPGLEVIQGLLEGLDHPERRFPAIHVTGSKGKGSVAAMAASVLAAHGRRTGLFTSPHLASYRERMRLNGRPIEAAAVVAEVERVEAVAVELERAGRIDRSPTFFELTTAVALDWFARRKADAAVIEVGIGGRLDSTNVLDARVGVITTVELEHTDVLGPTLADIAREKSGILRPGMSAILGELPPEAEEVARRTADHRGLPVWRLGHEITVSDRELAEDRQTVTIRCPGLILPAAEIPLLGAFQADNAALAVASAVRFLEATGTPVVAERVRIGLANVRWPGRLECVGRRPDLFYDVAHTPASARAIAESLGEIAPFADPAECAILFGCLRGKDVAGILDGLAPLARTLVVVPVLSDRAVPAAELKVEAAGRFPRVVVAARAADGLALARAATGPEGFTLVVGSDYLVGELLRGAAGGEEPDLSDPGREGARPPRRSRGPAGPGRGA